MDKHEGAARGSVCAVHNEYSAPGECRWCEPVVEKPDGAPVERVPLMNLDRCAGCGKSGLEILRAGETYKTHQCFRPAASAVCVWWIYGATRCGRPAAWEYTAVSEAAKKRWALDPVRCFWCGHHLNTIPARLAEGWTKTPVYESGPAPKAQKP